MCSYTGVNSPWGDLFRDLCGHILVQIPHNNQKYISIIVVEDKS